MLSYITHVLFSTRPYYGHCLDNRIILMGASTGPRDARWAMPTTLRCDQEIISKLYDAQQIYVQISSAWSF